MNEMQVFSNPMFGNLSVIMQNGEPWFVAREVAACLGYTKLSKPYEHCKSLKILKTSDLELLGITAPSPRGLGIIPESDLYRLVMRSTLPTAEKFQDWVCDDVLPSIRKHGVYATPATVEKMLQDPDNIIKIFQALKAEREAKEQALAQIEKQRPKVIFAEAVECSKTSILIGELAKLIKQNGVDIGQNRLFQWLRQNGYLTMKNFPTQYSMELGILEVVERSIVHPDGSMHTVTTPKVTGKGQQYFINKFLR